MQVTGTLVHPHSVGRGAFRTKPLNGSDIPAGYEVEAREHRRQRQQENRNRWRGPSIALDMENDGPRTVGSRRAVAIAFGGRSRDSNIKTSWKYYRRTQYQHREPLHGHPWSLWAQRTNAERIDHEPDIASLLREEAVELRTFDPFTDEEWERFEQERYEDEYGYQIFLADMEDDDAEREWYEFRFGRPLRRDESFDEFGSVDLGEEPCSCQHCDPLFDASDDAEEIDSSYCADECDELDEDDIEWFGRTFGFDSAESEDRYLAKLRRYHPTYRDAVIAALEETFDGPTRIGIGRSRGLRKVKAPTVAR